MNPLLGMLFNAIGLVLGIVIYVTESRRVNPDREHSDKIMAAGIIGGGAAATLTQRILSGFPPDALAWLLGGGRTIIAGVIGGWIAVEIAKRRLGVRESTGTMWALALPVGEFFGRIGCWFNGCCFGSPTDLAWKVHSHGADRHPTQFLLAGWAAMTFFAVLSVPKRARRFPVFLMLWSIGRLLIEPLRESASPVPWLVPAVCSALLLIGGIMLRRNWLTSAERPAHG